MLLLTSSAFKHASAVPPKYTGDGEDVSPPLAWSDAPPETKSFALICDDPDAPRGTWVHWVLFNMPADQKELRENAKTELLGATVQGRNDFGKIGYGGPAPPKGKPHRYYFKLYALDGMMELPEGATKEQLETAMEGHILGRAELMGTYAR